MKFQFVKGRNLGIDVALIDSRCLQIGIHERWLSYDNTHVDTFCEEERPAEQWEENQPFSCDHIILELWDLILGQCVASNGEIAKSVMCLKNMARTRVPQMPRNVLCEQTNRAGELKVSWESIESSRNKDKPVKVTSHVDTCDDYWDDPHINKQDKGKCFPHK